MHRSPALFVVAFTLVLSTACGGGDTALTCSVLSDPENCWAASALAFSECLPASATGVLAADRSSCAFPDGSRVVFDTALPRDTSALDKLAFTIERGGETCARFVDTFHNRMELTTGGETVVSELHNGSDFHVHCPGGPSYTASFDSLFDCAAEGAPPPTDGFRVEANIVEFSISSITTPDVLFTCTAP